MERVAAVVRCTHLGGCDAAQLDVLDGRRGGIEGRHRDQLDLLPRRRQEGRQLGGVPLQRPPARLLPERRQLVEQALDHVDHVGHGASRRVDRRRRVRLEPRLQLLELLAHGSEHLIDFVAAALHQRLERQGPFLERGADRGDELLELRSSFLQQRSKLSRSLVEQVEQWLDESDELAGCSLRDSLRC